MLTKVEPEDRGIPHFKDIYVSNIKVKQAKKAINANGLDKSSLQNFNFENVTIKADNAGEINYADKWTWKNVNIISSDKTMVSLKNSTGVTL